MQFDMGHLMLTLFELQFAGGFSMLWKITGDLSVVQIPCDPIGEAIGWSIFVHMNIRTYIHMMYPVTHFAMYTFVIPRWPMGFPQIATRGPCTLVLFLFCPMCGSYWFLNVV